MDCPFQTHQVGMRAASFLCLTAVEAALAADLLAHWRTASTSFLGCTWESTDNGYSWSGNGAGTGAEAQQSELAICLPLMF